MRGKASWDEAAKRRDKILVLMRSSMWMTSAYVAYRTGFQMDQVMRDIKAMAEFGLIETAQGLDSGERAKPGAESGELVPAAVRVTLVRLTDEGRKRKLSMCHIEDIPE